MAVLERRLIHRPSAQCVRELRVPIAIERRQAVIDFYAGVIGLPPDAERALPGGVSLGRARNRVFFVFRHDPAVEPLRRRFTIGMQSLDVVSQRLAETGWPFREVHGLWASDRAILLTDPQGHRVELRQFREI